MSNRDAPHNSVRVLVVEDSEDQRHLLRTYFELAGCEVTIAETAELALAASADIDLDLAVIDLILPGMNGWELIDRIRADHPDCAIAVTSVLDAESYPKSDASLPKPVSRAHVHRVLKQCVPRWSA